MMKKAPHIKKILSADLEGYRVSLLFSDGFRGTVNLSDIFHKRAEIVKEVLRGNLFERCFVESGALAWPNGLELCPYALRLEIEKELAVGKNRSSARKRRHKTA